MNFNKQNLFIIISSILILVIIIPIGLNFLLHFSVSFEVIGEEENWLEFWGNYLGALASFVMAAIAFFTLQQNSSQLSSVIKQNKLIEDQLNILKRQQRPFVYPQIFISNNYAEGSQYCIQISNYGNEIATGIKIEIKNKVMLDEFGGKYKVFCTQFNNNDFKYPLSPKETACIVICPSNNDNQMNAQERIDYGLFLEALKKSTTIIDLTYDNFQDEKNPYHNSTEIDMQYVTVQKTIESQSINDISRSLQEISKYFTNNKDGSDNLQIERHPDDENIIKDYTKLPHHPFITMPQPEVKKSSVGVYPPTS